MKKDINTQEHILFCSFQLFLNKNYRDVTIADIEKEIGMSRGAIFYYYKNKNELFNAVIDKYIIDKQSTEKIIDKTDINSLKSFIEAYVQGIKKSMDIIRKAKVKNILRCYFNLIYNAIDQYPGFAENSSSIIFIEQKTWQDYIKLGIKNGEIKSGTDNKKAAIIFQSIFYGLSYISSMSAKQEVLELNVLQASFFDYYDKIKK